MDRECTNTQEKTLPITSRNLARRNIVTPSEGTASQQNAALSIWNGPFADFHRLNPILIKSICYSTWHAENNGAGLSSLVQSTYVLLADFVKYLYNTPAPRARNSHGVMVWTTASAYLSQVKCALVEQYHPLNKDTLNQYIDPLERLFLERETMHGIGRKQAPGMVTGGLGTCLFLGEQWRNARL